MYVAVTGLVAGVGIPRVIWFKGGIPGGGVGIIAGPGADTEGADDVSTPELEDADSEDWVSVAPATEDVAELAEIKGDPEDDGSGNDPEEEEE